MYKPIFSQERTQTRLLTHTHTHTHTNIYIHTHIYIHLYASETGFLQHVKVIQLSSSSVSIFINFLYLKQHFSPTCKGNALSIVFKLILIALYLYFTCLLKGTPAYCSVNVPWCPSRWWLPRALLAMFFGTA